MLITGLKQSSSGRFTVCFEDGSEIKSTLNVVTDLRLYSGLEADEALISRLRTESQKQLVRDKAIELLSLRQMSEKELRDKLLQKGCDEAACEYAVRWLADNHFLNDFSYAQAVVRHYAAKGYGALRIKQELLRRGIAKELWDEVLESMPDGDEKIDKFISSRLTDLSDRAKVQKVSNALLRRGFSWNEIHAAMERFRAEQEDY